MSPLYICGLDRLTKVDFYWCFCFLLFLWLSCLIRYWLFTLHTLLILLLSPQLGDSLLFAFFILSLDFALTLFTNFFFAFFFFFSLVLFATFLSFKFFFSLLFFFCLPLCGECSFASWLFSFESYSLCSNVWFRKKGLTHSSRAACSAAIRCCTLNSSSDSLVSS